MSKASPHWLNVASKYLTNPRLLAQLPPSIGLIVASIVTVFFCVSQVSAKDQRAARVDIEHHYFGRTLTWTVTNQMDHPCVRIEIPSAVAYDHVVPDGWEFDETFDGLRAWTDERAFSIFPGQSKKFRITAGGNSAKPGYTDTILDLTDGNRVAVKSVATFKFESNLTRVIPPITIMVLAMLVALVCRKRSMPETNCATD